ncbi:MAG: hypothetical protein GX596_05895 [Propionibacterium sp.]|nr:hypothetical protein [Propionibacterium sp.]
MGPRFSTHDLDVIAYMGVTSKQIAEHLIWDDRDTVLDSFAAIQSAMTKPPSGDEAACYHRLQQWRDGHDDPRVAAVSDADLGRLAAARIDDFEGLGRALATLADGAVLADYPHELWGVLHPGSRADAAPEARRAVDDTVGDVAPEPEVGPGSEPEAVPEPLPEPELPDPSKPFEWVQIPRFGPFDWNRGTAQPLGFVVATTLGGEVRLEWTPAPGDAPVTLYRVVQSADTWPTGAPEVASLVGVTYATAGSLPLRPRGPVTYLAIWANQGSSLLEASQSQPVLIGASEVVWPPSHFTLNVTADKAVAASWRAPEGSRVEVQRFPHGVPIHYDQARMLPPDAVRTGGFLDREPPLGEEIVYAAFAVADLPTGGSSVSAPVTANISITPDAQPVQLDVKRSTTSPGSYDLTWIPPRHGRVVLFATKDRPPQGLENAARTREIIESQGLTPDLRVTYPADDLGGIKTISGFVVDQSWVRAHFVAVHWVSDELVWVGPPVSMVTPHAPEWARVIERVDAQILTFPWPEGVSIVEAYQGPRGATIDPEANQPIAELTRDDYDKTGGMRITRTLPSNGCSIHLFGVVYLDGAPVHSAPVSIDYEGITRLRYEIVPMLANQQVAHPSVSPAFYHLYATVDDELHETPVALVGHHSRIPLEPGDGELIQQATVSLAAGQRVFVGSLPVGGRARFVRLFINLRASETGAIAVLDPHVETLKVRV